MKLFSTFILYFTHSFVILTSSKLLSLGKKSNKICFFTRLFVILQQNYTYNI